MANSRSAVCAIALFLGCSAAWSADERSPATSPPTAAETNAFIQSGNTYRQLVKGSLAWKAPSTAECMSARLRLETIATPSPLIDAASIHQKLLIEVVQRAEESTYSQLHSFSVVLYEAVRARCFDLGK